MRCLQPLPHPLLYAGEIGGAQMRRGVVSKLRNPFRVWGAPLANSRYLEPEIGFRVVLGHALALYIHQPQAVLRRVITFLGRLAKPESSLGVVLGHATAQEV